MTKWAPCFNALCPNHHSAGKEWQKTADSGRLLSRGGKLRSRDGKVRSFLPVPRSTKLLIPPSLSLVLSTHLVTYNLTVFMLIRSFNAWQGFNFIIIFTGLLPLLIHLIFIISFLLYNCCKHIRSIINYFSCVVLSLTKQLYKDFESVQRVISNCLSYRIFLIVALIAVPILNL